MKDFTDQSRIAGSDKSPASESLEFKLDQIVKLLVIILQLAGREIQHQHIIDVTQDRDVVGNCIEFSNQISEAGFRTSPGMLCCRPTSESPLFNKLTEQIGEIS